MGINFEIKSGKVFLFAAVLVVVLSEASSAQRNRLHKEIDCRKFVFAPPCRGIAAKRDTRTADIRFTSPPEDDDYFMDNQKTASDENFVSANGLLGLLKKAISKDTDYYTGTNYLA